MTFVSNLRKAVRTLRYALIGVGGGLVLAASVFACWWAILELLGHHSVIHH